MLRPPALAFLALVLPPTLSVGERAHLESEARSLGGRLGRAIAALSVSQECDLPASNLPDVVSSAGDESGVYAGLSELALASKAPGGKTKAKAGGHGATPPRSGHGVHIAASTVLRLANRGTVPEGRPVTAAGARPAGIELSNVSALGVGVHDGDVLTEVAGQPVKSEGQIVGAVLALRARRAGAISAVFYRGQERWSLVVDMPYPPGS